MTNESSISPSDALTGSASASAFANGEHTKPSGPVDTDRILDDFRRWLGECVVSAGPVATADPEIDLQTLVGHFTALRHEINLQTKSARATLEQNGEAIQKLGSAVDRLNRTADEFDPIKPLIKGIFEALDNLTLALRQVRKQRDALVESADDWEAMFEIPEIPAIPEANGTGPTPGFWARLFGAKKPPIDAEFAKTVGRQMMVEWRDDVSALFDERRTDAAEAADRARSAIDAMITGYQMSVNRLEKLLDQYGLQPIACEGTAFDPETMEAVDLVEAEGRAAGEVVEELRRGYLRNGTVIRFAQVRVAR